MMHIESIQRLCLLILHFLWLRTQSLIQCSMIPNLSMDSSIRSWSQTDGAFYLLHDGGTRKKEVWEMSSIPIQRPIAWWVSRTARLKLTGTRSRTSGGKKSVWLRAMRTAQSEHPEEAARCMLLTGWRHIARPWKDHMSSNFLEKNSGGIRRQTWHNWLGIFTMRVVRNR